MRLIKEGRCTISTITAYLMVLALMGTVPGENAGWGTGEVGFIAYADTSEHQEIYPIAAGKYLIEASIILAEYDPMDILYYVTSVEVCYDEAENIHAGDIIYISGTYYDGACPIPYCNRVVADYIDETEYPYDDDDDYPPDDEPENDHPEVITGSAEPTETTVTLRGILEDDGDMDCRCMFAYYKYDDQKWYTEWQGYFQSGDEFSQVIAGLEPDTMYFYYAAAEQYDEYYGYYDSGRVGTFKTLPETISPIPDPVVWLTEPNQVDISSISMMAEIARDVAGPEEYLFDFVSSPTGGAGGSDSIWQFSPSYLDVGLNPNHQYGYRVKARDGLANPTQYSSTQYAYSDIETPESVEFGAITIDSIQAKSSNELSGLDRGNSGLKLQNITAGQVSNWKQNNDFWTSEELHPNTRYAFKAQARNGDGDRTDFSPLKWVYTHAKEPVTTGFSNITVNSINIHWSDNGNPIGTQYWCENTLSNENSGWITKTQWLDTDLSANTKFSYQVKARNGDSVETAFSNTVQKFSAIESPTDVVFGTITPNSIQVRSENTPSGLDRESSGLRFENITAGRMSSWQQNNNYWNSDDLLPNRSYSFRAQARNGNGEQTSHSVISSAYTHANTPTSATFTGITTSSIQVHWSPNGNPPGTLYVCENTTDNTNSGTTILTSWDSTNLQTNTQYSFRVKAQNAVGVSTTFSADTQKYTAIETPTGIVFGQVTNNSIELKSLNTPSGLNRGNSGLRFENATEAELSQWQKNNNYWTSTGLLPNTLYVFRAQARNGDGDETSYGRTNYTYTLSNPPSPADFTYVTDTTIQANWGTNSNPYGTLYLCQNITTGATSGWISGTNWENVDLSPYTTYSYQVKSRNENGIETDWVSLGQQTTGYRSLTIQSTSGGQVSSPGEDVFQFAPGTTVDITASPDAGHHFTHWSGSAVDADRVANPKAAQTTVLVDAHYTLVANFLQTNIYVDSRATGANDGSTWDNAFRYLQDALNTAQVGNHVLVAQGIYNPDLGQNYTPGDYTVSFALPNGVTLKGGYAGVGNANPDTRNINTYETILSGDLNGDDNPVREVHDLYSETSRLDNSFHVVTAHDVDNSTSLEGITIKGGNSFDGSGIQLIRGDIVIIQCTIKENRAGFISGDGDDGWGEGAGISCYLSRPLIADCTFYHNWAGAMGGAVFNLHSNPTITNCTFRNNTAGLEGGGLYNEDSNCILVDSILHGNWSSDGGAIFNIDECNIRITNCKFMGNAGHNSGGAIFDTGKTIDVINSVFSANLAFNKGGAMAITEGMATITNCTFNRNVADNTQGGGEALDIYNSTVTIANCILWDHTINVQPQITLTGTLERNTELSISYSDVLDGIDGISQKGLSHSNWGSGNINTDPRFQNTAGADTIVGTPDDNLSLRSGSSCIDSGNNTMVPSDADDLDMDDNISERIPLDLDGQSRFIDSSTQDTGVADSPEYPQIVDMGAYEY